MSGMKQILIISLFCWMSGMLMAQNVTNVVARQVGNTVEVTYDLDQATTINLMLSRDGGATYAAIPKTISGDVGEDVQAGHKKIVWNLMADGEDWDIERARFKVVAQLDDLTFTIKDVSFKMIAVMGGSFMMGCTSEQGGDCEKDETPAHLVTLDDYWIGQTEVTQALWKAVMGNNPSEIKGNNKPVENVFWNHCQEFIAKLNSIFAHLLGDKRFAFPTEAQWEYAARGGQKSRGYKYCGSDNLSSVAWCAINSENTTHTVGTKSPNELGVYDMTGNVYEWCQDWYGTYSSGLQTNPLGSPSGSHRVCRGGSWYNLTRDYRISSRTHVSPKYYDGRLGLRLVLQ